MNVSFYAGLAILASVKQAAALVPCSGTEFDNLKGCPAQMVNASFDNCTGWWWGFNNTYFNCRTYNSHTCEQELESCAGSPYPAPGAYPAPSSLLPCKGPRQSDYCNVFWKGCADGYAFSGDGTYSQCVFQGSGCSIGSPCGPAACAAEAPGGNCTNIKPDDPACPENTCLQYYQLDGKGDSVQCMGQAIGLSPCVVSSISCVVPCSGMLAPGGACTNIGSGETCADYYEKNGTDRNAQCTDTAEGHAPCEAGYTCTVYKVSQLGLFNKQAEERPAAAQALRAGMN